MYVDPFRMIERDCHIGILLLLKSSSRQTRLSREIILQSLLTFACVKPSQLV